MVVRARCLGKAAPADPPDTLEAGGERMSLAWAVSVPMSNRDLARRMAAELGSAA